MATTAIAGPLISTKTERADPRRSSISQQWLNEFGRAEINFGKTNKDLHSDIALLFPLQQDQRQLLFTQGNWRRSQGNTTLNIGVGQRWFSETASYWGYNLFYDYQLQGHHQRLGLGLEQHTNRLSWALNGYLPLSAKRGGDHQANTVRPAQGVDLRLQYQPLQQPHWRFTLMGERYFGHTLAESDKSLCHNRSAVTAGVDYTPWPLITAGYGYQLGSGRQRTHQWQLTLTYRLGIPLAQQLDPQQVAAAHSLAGSRLALVQRNHHILLQQQPNDTIRLELQPELRGKAGTQQTVTFRLHSPRPRDEWTLEWQGDLLAHTETPQIKGAGDQAILILPNRPGIYTLQLQAHNARNKKGSSNQMRIIVEEWPVAGKTGEDLLPQDKAPSQSLQEKNSPHSLPLEPQGKITDQTRPVEADSVGSEPVESESVESESVESESVELDSVELDSVELDSVELDSVELDSVELDSVELDSVESDAVESDAVESDAVESDAVESDAVESDAVESDVPEQIQLPENSHQQDLTAELKTADCTPTNSTTENKTAMPPHQDDPATPTEEDYQKIGAKRGDNNTQLKKQWHIISKNLEEQIANSTSQEEKEILEQKKQDCINSLKKIKANNKNESIELVYAGISSNS